MTVGSGFAISPSETNPTTIVHAIRQLFEGRSNAVGTFTLRVSQTTTTVSSVTCGPNSIIIWMPTTANAATQMTTMYVSSIAPQTFTLTHASSVNADQTFNYLAIG